MDTPWKEMFTTEPGAQIERPTVVTSDIYAVAYLLAHDVEIAHTAPGRNARQTVFHFDRTAQPRVDEYHRGGQVNAQKYAAAIRYVKSLLHGAR